MRLILGLLLPLSLLLAGCGEDSGSEVLGADPTSSSSAPAPTNGPVEDADVVLVSGSAAGGEVDATGAVLDSDAAIAEFTAQFDGGDLAGQIQQAVADLAVTEDQVVVGAVVALGCEPPSTASVERTDAGIEITAAPVKTDKQCFAAVTTVALVAVDAALV